jgi:hypothetical protein
VSRVNRASPVSHARRANSVSPNPRRVPTRLRQPRGSWPRWRAT